MVGAEYLDILRVKVQLAVSSKFFCQLLNRYFFQIPVSIYDISFCTIFGSNWWRFRLLFRLSVHSEGVDLLRSCPGIRLNLSICHRRSQLVRILRNYILNDPCSQHKQQVKCAMQNMHRAKHASHRHHHHSWS